MAAAVKKAVAVGRCSIKMWHFEMTTSRSLLREAFDWHMRTPKWLRMGGYTEAGEFVHGLSQGVNYAGYIDGQFAGLIHGEHRDDETVEGHCYVGPKVDNDFVTALISFAKREALKTYQKVVVEIPVKHRTMNGLILRAGFFDLGLHKWKGVVRGRLFETGFYMAR